MRTLEGCDSLFSIEHFSVSTNGGRCDPSGVDPFLLIRTRGWSDLAPPPANGLQAFGLNEASSPTVREESRDCPPLLIAPLSACRLDSERTIGDTSASF